MPPLTALRAFAALAEAGSVVRAGDLLNVSHAAISQQLKALEEHMGLSFTERVGRELQLTEAGRQLAQALEQGFETISRQITELTGADAQRPLQITTTPLFAVGWLMSRLARFQAVHPEINLLINPNVERVDPAPGGADIALRFGAGVWPGFDAELLVPTDVAVVASPNLVGEEDINDMQTLVKFPWLQEIGVNDVPDWLRQQGLCYERLRTLELPGHLMLDAVRRGQGLMIGSYSNLVQDVEAGTLRVLFRDHGETGYFIVTHPGIIRPQARAFIRWLRKEAAIPG